MVLKIELLYNIKKYKEKIYYVLQRNELYI